MSQLVELITKWEKYKHVNPGGTVSAFAAWLSKETGPVESVIKVFKADDPQFDAITEAIKLTSQAGYLVGKLYQYLLIYTKPVMKKYSLHSMDDFGYLATVDWHGTISKSKACAAMLQEITTGSDIIKRLVGLAYLKEVADKGDKRQRLLQLTAKGKKVLVGLHQDFAALPDVLGNLEMESRRSLVTWLMQLDEFHDQVVKNKNN